MSIVEQLAAGSGLGLGDDWRVAVEVAVSRALEPLGGARVNLLVLFASAEYQADYTEMLALAQGRANAEHVVGCSASAVIANARELEDDAGVAALALALPAGGHITTRHVAPNSARDAQLLGAATDVRGILLLADPFTADSAALIGQLEHDYPGVPVIGGLATGDPRVGETFLFHDSSVWQEGAVAVAFHGSIALRPVVSQGCEPIGQTWTITSADHNIVHTIGGRSAYRVLVETVQALDDERRERVNGNLLVGLAMDEYRDEFKRGDFLIRNLIGVDQASGAIAIAAEVQVGQTLQFQIRDARAADEELRAMLRSVKEPNSTAALLFACNGRGIGLFGEPDHDAQTVNELLGPLPLAGLFCNGEIGPVGPRTFLHGFTASLALIVPAE